MIVLQVISSFHTWSVKYIRLLITQPSREIEKSSSYGEVDLSRVKFYRKQIQIKQAKHTQLHQLGKLGIAGNK